MYGVPASTPIPRSVRLAQRASWFRLTGSSGIYASDAGQIVYPRAGRARSTPRTGGVDQVTSRPSDAVAQTMMPGRRATIRTASRGVAA
jgi:hypothetical protein